MDRRSGIRRPSTPNTINDTLETCHQLGGRANFLLVIMLVKRVFWRSNLDESIRLTEMKLKLLRELQDEINNRTTDRRGSGGS